MSKIHLLGQCPQLRGLQRGTGRQKEQEPCYGGGINADTALQLSDSKVLKWVGIEGKYNYFSCGKLRLSIFNKDLESFSASFLFLLSLNSAVFLHVASYPCLFTVLQFLIIDAHV